MSTLFKAWFTAALGRFDHVSASGGVWPQTFLVGHNHNTSAGCCVITHHSYKIRADFVIIKNTQNVHLISLCLTSLWPLFLFLCSLTQIPPNTPRHPTARTRAAPRAPTPPTAVSLLWMVWNTPWMAESKKQSRVHANTSSLHHPAPTIPFLSVRTCYKVPRVIFSSLPALTPWTTKRFLLLNTGQENIPWTELEICVALSQVIWMKIGAPGVCVFSRSVSKLLPVGAFVAV